MSRYTGRRIGSYTLESRLGQGGMGAVYLARREEDNATVAVKLLYPQYSDDPEYVARFRREAAVTGELDHPNIVRQLEWGESPEVGCYQVLEYIEGRNLRQLLEQNPGGLPVEQAIELAGELLSGLEYAHARKIVHRDVKPENMLLDQQGRLHVTDFGVARVPQGTRLTRTGLMPGTPAYMSPEQLSNAQVDQASDLYSAGIVLYELLTGVTPFASENVAEVIQRQVYQLPHPPSYRRPGLPPELDAVVLKALEKKPRDRFRDAAEFRSALQRLGPVPTAEPSPLPPAAAVPEPTLQVDLSPTPPSGPAWLWLMPATLLAVAIVLVWQLFGSLQKPPEWYTEAVGALPVPGETNLLWGTTLFGAETALFEPTRTLSARERALALGNRLAESLRADNPPDPEKLEVREDEGDWLIAHGDDVLVRVTPTLALELSAPPEAVARYWRALLQDHLNLRRGEEPEYLAEHEREYPLRQDGDPVSPLFATVYKRARHYAREGPLPTYRVMDAIASLPERQREQFREAARSVPLPVPEERS